MNDLPDDAHLETPWRQYYENPLTVATNAMLHINGGEQTNAISLISYEDYKAEQSGTTVGGAIEIKLSNGIIEAVPGAGQVESIFLQGGAEVVKREPEDLTRKCISPVERIVLSDKRRPVLLHGHSGSPPALISAQSLKDELDSVVKEEDSPRSGHTIIIQAPLDSDKMSTTGYLGNFPAASPQSSYETVPTYLASSPQPYISSSSPVIRGSSAVYSSTEPYYREYYQVSEPQYTTFRQEYSTQEVSFDRYARAAPSYKQILTVDSSPDSGISSDTVPPREQALSLPQQQAFTTYEDLSQPQIITSDLRPLTVSATSPGAHRVSPSVTPSANTTRVWHDIPRHSEITEKIQIPKIQTDDDKIHIEKLHSPYGFKYFLEAPISTSPRREDDRITYINKGQFYPITMEYVPDPERQLKPGVTKSVIMLMFREEKSAEDESKAWYFWHGRQHSVKQRILDVDTKNSVGLVNCIEEVSHNAIAVYWNPLESSAKINIAVQCLSTDFSSQKGVKGLPLHLQVDTYEDARDSGYPAYHRGYCQIKVFCDKGAERKTRDEERRAQKRRINPTTRKKYEDLYHGPCDRSEFYSMADLCKEPVFFKPNEDSDKLAYMNMELQPNYYNHDPENGVCGVSIGDSIDGPSPTLLSPRNNSPPTSVLRNHRTQTPALRLTHCISAPSSPVLSPTPPSSSTCPQSTSCPSVFTTLLPLQSATSPKTNSLRFHYSLPQNYGEIHKELGGTLTNGTVPPPNMEEMFAHAHKRTRLTPPVSERVMIFVRREGEEIYTTLHLIPPGILGLLNAIEQKFQIQKSNIKNLLRKNKIGIIARIDDDMLRHYCNEDYFILDIQRRDAEMFDLTLIELSSPVD